MKTFGGWSFPDTETHLISWLLDHGQFVDEHLAYQYDKYQAALRYTPSRRRAVDVGAHVGLWSYYMARDFRSLDAFEPVLANVECWLRNVPGHAELAQVTLHACALGVSPANVGMMNVTGASTAFARIDPFAQVKDVTLVHLDSFDLEQVDLLKIDCEGSEYEVLRGAEATIDANQPTIIIEQKSNVKGVMWLERMGYRVRETIAGDHILTARG